MNHVKNSIRLSSKINSKYYSVHAGFLCDLKPSDLGNKIKKKKLYNRKKYRYFFTKYQTDFSICKKIQY